jgi:Ring finger domain/CUE domain
MQRIRNYITNPIFFYWVGIGNIAVWVAFIIPNILLKGVLNSVASLNSDPHSLPICFFLFFSIACIILFSMFFTTNWYLGPVTASERRLVLSNFIKDSPPLQFCILIIGEPNRNSLEGLIWSVILCSLACCKGFCVLLKGRISDNKLTNIQEFNRTILVVITLFILTTILLFKEAGFWILLMINFESIFIYKECLQAYYQISKNKNISGSTDLLLQIFETILKIAQWLQIAFAHGDLFSASPVEFLLVIKLQSHFYSLISQVNQYAIYKDSIHKFMIQYPPLSSSEVAVLGDEKCCICWDNLASGTSCKITCNHVLHIECIWKWMLRTSDRKCPMCKQIFLITEERPRRSISSWISIFNRPAQQDFTRLSELFPNFTEQELVGIVQRTGSVQAAIDSLLGD